MEKLKIIRNILIGWTILIIILHIVAMIIYEDLGVLVEIPATLLIYAGIPYGIFWVIRKKITKRESKGAV